MDHGSGRPRRGPRVSYRDPMDQYGHLIFKPLAKWTFRTKRPYNHYTALQLKSVSFSKLQGPDKQILQGPDIENRIYYDLRVSYLGYERLGRHQWHHFDGNTDYGVPIFEFFEKYTKCLPVHKQHIMLYCCLLLLGDMQNSMKIDLKRGKRVE